MDYLKLLQTHAIEDLKKIDLSSYYNNPFFVAEIIKNPKFDNYSEIINKNNNKSLFLAIIRTYPEHISLFPKNVLKDDYFVIACLEANIEVAKYIPQCFKKKDLLNWFIWRYSSSHPLKYLPEEYQDNFYIAKQLVTYDSINFRDLSSRLRDNKELYSISVNKQNMSSLFIYSGESIRSDKDLCIKAISQSFKRYQYITDKLKKDENFFIKLLKLNYHFLELAPDSIKDNEKCVYEAVKKHPHSLVYADPRLLADYKFAQKIYKAIDISDFKQILRYFSIDIKEKFKNQV
jgi:Domain of unknown function (DUF4116)